MQSIDSSSLPATGLLPSDSAIPGWKRALDLACCLAALPFLLLGAIAVGLILAITSPGPLFFRQERVGYLGRRFMIYKFRTMHRGADISLHQAHVANLLRSNEPLRKMDGARDRRLIPGAWLLRATGTDELPQIINVLRGEMSIVGPRPCIPYEYEQYTPAQRERFRAAPGLTGLWQVSGKNRTTFEEMIRLDVRYGRTKSLAADLKIIARTGPALCRQLLDTGRQRRGAAPGNDSAASVPNRTAATFQT